MQVTVFLGSKYGLDPDHAQQAINLGKFLGDHKIDLKYGGSLSGLMGLIAINAKSNGSKITGVYPKNHFENELELPNVDTFIPVDTMDRRKELLIKDSEVFVILPGGIGTLEEVTQLLCEMSIGKTEKVPVLFLNSHGFYNNFLNQLSLMVKEGFLDLDIMNYIQEFDFLSDLTEKLLKLEEEKNA